MPRRPRADSEEIGVTTCDRDSEGGLRIPLADAVCQGDDTCSIAAHLPTVSGLHVSLVSGWCGKSGSVAGKFRGELKNSGRILEL